MAKFRTTLLLIFAPLIIYGCTNLAEDIEINAINNADIEKITQILDKKLTTVSGLADGAEIKLSSVTIDLKTVVTGEDAASFGVLVFSAGMTDKVVDTSSISIVMTEFKGVEDQKKLAPTKLDSFVNALNKIIQHASDYTVADLGTEKVTATLSFVVEESVSAGSDGFEIKPVTLTYSGSTKVDFTNTITLEFLRKAGSA